MFDNILFVKVGWTELHEGEDCTGEFAEPQQTNSWYERFNFRKGPDGRFYGFLPQPLQTKPRPIPQRKPVGS
jgi:hypothetical protein